MPDKYASFAELRCFEPAAAFSITILDRGSPVSVLAIHGGGIELGTSTIARALAGYGFNLYLFEGQKASGNTDLHITSTNFDEPQALALVSRSECVLTVHGCLGADEVTFMGGLSDGAQLQSALQRANFACARHADVRLQGRSHANNCNRGATGTGIQFELTRALRNRLCADASLLQTYADTVRAALG
jgi:phage replication-related protein YjqB (UPF0714/DUF867 family)